MKTYDNGYLEQIQKVSSLNYSQRTTQRLGKMSYRQTPYLECVNDTGPNKPAGLININCDK